MLHNKNELAFSNLTMYYKDVKYQYIGPGISKNENPDFAFYLTLVPLPKKFGWS